MDARDKILEASSLITRIATEELERGHYLIGLDVVAGDKDIDIHLANAILMLEKKKQLTSSTLLAVYTSTNPEKIAENIISGVSPVQMGQNISHGLENLAKLEKFGMNTQENREKVTQAKEKAIEVSLKLWNRKKSELIEASEKKSEKSSLAALAGRSRGRAHGVGIHANPAARFGKAHGVIVKELNDASKELHQPAPPKVVAPGSPKG